MIMEPFHQEGVPISPFMSYSFTCITIKSWIFSLFLSLSYNPESLLFHGSNFSSFGPWEVCVYFF
jgi:hypothetical protein